MLIWLLLPAWYGQFDCHSCWYYLENIQSNVFSTLENSINLYSQCLITFIGNNERPLWLFLKQWFFLIESQWFFLQLRAVWVKSCRSYTNALSICCQYQLCTNIKICKTATRQNCFSPTNDVALKARSTTANFISI